MHIQAKTVRWAQQGMRWISFNGYRHEDRRDRLNIDFEKLTDEEFLNSIHDKTKQGNWSVREFREIARRGNSFISKDPLVERLFRKTQENLGLSISAGISPTISNINTQANLLNNYSDQLLKISQDLQKNFEMPLANKFIADSLLQQEFFDSYNKKLNLDWMTKLQNQNIAFQKLFAASRLAISPKWISQIQKQSGGVDSLGLRNQIQKNFQDQSKTYRHLAENLALTGKETNLRAQESILEWPIDQELLESPINAQEVRDTFIGYVVKQLEGQSDLFAERAIIEITTDIGIGLQPPSPPIPASSSGRGGEFPKKYIYLLYLLLTLAVIDLLYRYFG